jgi:hypothetical protein
VCPIWTKRLSGPGFRDVFRASTLVPGLPRKVSRLKALAGSSVGFGLCSLSKPERQNLNATRFNADAVETAVLDAVEGFYRDHQPRWPVLWRCSASPAVRCGCPNGASSRRDSRWRSHSEPGYLGLDRYDVLLRQVFRITSTLVKVSGRSCLAARTAISGRRVGPALGRGWLRVRRRAGCGHRSRHHRLSPRRVLGGSRKRDRPPIAVAWPKFVRKGASMSDHTP